MKEARFTELINLYIDQQISAAEADELETEIRDNPARRRTYVEYCKLHRSTKLVYESFRSHAERGQAAPRGYAAIEQFEHVQRSRRFRWLYAVGGAAAAVACLSVVSLRYAASNAVVVTPAIQTVAQSAPHMAASDRLPPMGRSPAAESAANLLSLRNTLAMEVTLQPWLNAFRPETRVVDDGTSGQPLRSEPLFDDQLFAGRDLWQLQRWPVYRPHGTPMPQAPREFIGFQFQR